MALGAYSQHIILFVSYESTKKLQYYITLGPKGLPGANTLTYWTLS